ncbi:MAG: hypothetical protein OXU66_09455 [Gammaproteobacteria bacterium]|nr:hypothetical protein [Gammaproteobacteria bacterium]MDD9897216.1 hypothetical protein [Gammaproteobacteria bacterium]MDD9959157.1 hypothetical protein [Gammaproteobacteria bacterium]
MSLKVIELNDRGIKVGDESGIIVQSPGFALVVGDTLEVGDSAEQQARLQPTNSFNKYWHELSLEPISHSNKIRHFADLAYAQLLHLAEAGAIDKDVIFAVPGNFSRQQLAILLGLAQQSPFTTVGVVDSALAATVSAAQAEHIVYADIQLHQVVLTKLAIVGDHLETEGVVQIPGVGNQNFMNLMMQIATDMFIQQCRFNPQHNAESEQQLYNELPSWLLQDDKEKTLQLALKSATAVHTAKLPRETLITTLNDYYKKINEQISAIGVTNNAQLLLSKNLAELPGYQSALKQISEFVIVEDHSVNSACHQYRELIAGSDQGIHLVNKFPASALGRGTVDSSQQVSAAERPTHVLFANRAFAIGTIDIKNNETLNGSAKVSGTIVMNIANLPESLGRIEKCGDEVYLKCGNQQVFVNGSLVMGECPLNLGDRICFVKNGEEISLIQVNNGQ